MRPAHNISPSYGYFWLLFYFQAELHNISTPTFVLLPPVLLYNEADIYFLLKVLAEYLVGASVLLKNLMGQALLLHLGSCLQHAVKCNGGICTTWSIRHNIHITSMRGNYNDISQ